MQRNGKVVFVGDTKVGKTAIINSYGDLDINTQQTVGANSVPYIVKLNNGESVQLNVWDTAGQEVFKCLLPMYSRGSHAAVIVFDLSEKSSFDSIPAWMDFLRDDIDPSSVIIVGNKSDLHAVVTDDEITKLKSDYPNTVFMKTSALTGAGIAALFMAMAEIVRDAARSSSRSKPKVVEFKATPDVNDTCC